MLKKRLILTLFYDDGYFCLSRNFRLQKVGNINWLLDTYPFTDIVKFIDEVMIINVSSKTSLFNSNFLVDVEKILSKVFLPLTLGGGVRSIRDATHLFDFGADKIVLNTTIYTNSSLVSEIATKYGRQSIVASLDFTKKDNKYFAYCKNFNKKYEEFTVHLRNAMSCNVGELLLTSIDNDGTGNGLDLNIKDYIENIDLPVILSGGVGKPEHFYDALLLNQVMGVATANLFNFMGNSFEISKRFLLDKNINLRSL